MEKTALNTSDGPKIQIIRIIGTAQTRVIKKVQLK